MTMFAHHDDQTIIAQCTPSGSGALALIRISGADALIIATNISSLSSGKKIIDVPTHTIHYGQIITENKQTIDNVLFLVMHAPKTFTGEHTVEITCHNNPFIIEQIIQQAIAYGARIAQQGEFTKRAVLHDKIDLVQAESINELIHANTQLALKKSLAQLDGSFSQWLANIEKQLTKALALSEASFEFIDEEELEFGNQIKEIIHSTQATIAQLKKTFNQQQHIRQGIRIAIIGSVNAGKSSLFNALLGKDRAIVTDIAGTTRDVIEAGLYRHGNYWTLIDTAGLRQTQDTIEQQGIKRSFQEAQQADIILLVLDNSRTLSSEEARVYQELLTQYAHKIIMVLSKVDLPSAPQSIPMAQTVACSNTQQKGINNLDEQIQAKINTLFDAMESPFLLNQRQYGLLLGLEQQLAAITPLLDHNVQYELISHHLQGALAHMAELTGKSISEAGMDAVFREFCVGK